MKADLHVRIRFFYAETINQQVHRSTQPQTPLVTFCPEITSILKQAFFLQAKIIVF